MKKVIITIIAIISVLSSFGQRPVYDKYKDNQILSMEVFQWKFKPKWYYRIFHSRYKKKYDNSIKQYGPSILLTENTKKNKQKETDSVKRQYKQETFKFIDRSLGGNFLGSPISQINNMRQDVLTLVSDLQGLNVDSQNINVILLESVRLLANLAIIKNQSHLSTAEKRKAMFKNLDEWAVLLKNAQYLRDRYKFVNIVKQELKIDETWQMINNGQQHINDIINNF